MLEKERLQRIFDREEVDRKPVMCPGGMMNMITTELMKVSGATWPEAHTDPLMMANMAQAAYDYKCFENVGVPFCMTIESEMMGAEVTMGTTIAEPHVTNYAITHVKDWTTLKKPVVTEGRMGVVIEAIKILKSRDLPVPIVGNVVGPVSVASSVQDAVQYYKDMRKHPKEMHEFMEFVSDAIADFAVAQVEAGADVICMSDPSGTGEILGPKLFDEYAVTYINRVLERLKPYKVKTIVHICGQMNNVFEQVNKVESDVLSFDAVVSLKKAREHLGDHLLMGNISTFALECSSVEKVATITRACVKNGSDIITPACGLGTGSPLVNIQTILKTLKEDAEAEAAAV